MGQPRECGDVNQWLLARMVAWASTFRDVTSQNISAGAEGQAGTNGLPTLTPTVWFLGGPVGPLQVQEATGLNGPLVSTHSWALLRFLCLGQSQVWGQTNGSLGGTC